MNGVKFTLLSQRERKRQYCSIYLRSSTICTMHIHIVEKSMLRLCVCILSFKTFKTTIIFFSVHVFSLNERRAVRLCSQFLKLNCTRECLVIYFSQHSFFVFLFIMFLSIQIQSVLKPGLLRVVVCKHSENLVLVKSGKINFGISKICNKSCSERV